MFKHLLKSKVWKFKQINDAFIFYKDLDFIYVARDISFKVLLTSDLIKESSKNSVCIRKLMVRRGTCTPSIWIAVHCYTNGANLSNFRMLLIAYTNFDCFIVLLLNYD